MNCLTYKEPFYGNIINFQWGKKILLKKVIGVLPVNPQSFRGTQKLITFLIQVCHKSLFRASSIHFRQLKNNPCHGLSSVFFISLFFIKISYTFLNCTVPHHILHLFIIILPRHRQNILHMMQLPSSACCFHPCAPYMRVRHPVLHPRTKEQVRHCITHCYRVRLYKEIVKLNVYTEDWVLRRNTSDRK